MIKKCEINFILSDLAKLKTKLSDKYDIIYLSNIAQYVHKYESLKNDNDEECMKELERLKKIIISLTKFLNDDGLLVIAYLYDYLEEYLGINNKWAYIHRNEKRSKIFPSNKYSYITFPGVEDLNHRIVHGSRLNKKDAALIYRKKS